MVRGAAAFEYRGTAISILASTAQSGARIEVTGIGPDGATLTPVTRLDGVDISLEEGRPRADVPGSLRELPVGKRKVMMRVADGDHGRTQIAELAIVSLNATRMGTGADATQLKCGTGEAIDALFGPARTGSPAGP